MASPSAAYPNSPVSQSLKTQRFSLFERLAVPSQLRSIAIQVVLDGIGFIAILVVLFMVPA